MSGELDLRLVVLPRDLGRLRHAPLGRALGGAAQTAIDATAGWLGDSVLLAAMGLRVRAIERHPEVARRAREALAAVRTDAVLGPIVARIELIEADAIPLLAGLSEHERPEIVHLDPMFPAKTKSALAPGPAQRLQALVGVDADVEALFDSAQRAATVRVLWKRPDGSPPGRPDRSTHVDGRTVRYDIWVRPGARARRSRGGVAAG